MEETQIESEEEEELTKRIKELLKSRIKKIKDEIHNTTIKEDIPKRITDYSDQFFTIHNGKVILDATFIGKRYGKESVLLIYAPTNKNQTIDLAPVMGGLVDITGLDFNKPWKDAEPGYVILTIDDWERIVKDFNKNYWNIYNCGDEKTRTKCKIIQMEVKKETINTETQKEWIQDLLKLEREIIDKEYHTKYPEFFKEEDLVPKSKEKPAIDRTTLLNETKKALNLFNSIRKEEIKKYKDRFVEIINKELESKGDSLRIYIPDLRSNFNSKKEEIVSRDHHSKEKSGTIIKIISIGLERNEEMITGCKARVILAG